MTSEPEIDLLAGAQWFCRATPPGSSTPADWVDWFDPSAAVPAPVPGTVASALTAAEIDWATVDLDGQDWWYRCTFTAPEQTTGAHATDHWLIMDGLATIADVWLNGQHLLSSDNMFLPQRIMVSDLQSENVLLIRFSSVRTFLAAKRPRPRWKVARVRHQGLRWLRTTLLGRLIGWPQTAPPIGPWRDISLVPRLRPTADLRVGYRDGKGQLQITVRAGGAAAVLVTVGTAQYPLPPGEDGCFAADLEIPGIKPWWPHTHGNQPLYPVSLLVDGVVTDLAPVGFRSISVDRSQTAFTILINGTPIFCRGAYWTPLDPIGLTEDPVRLRAALTQVRHGSMNMIRIGGETVWPGSTLLELCDELGIMIWQDCMFAYLDYPDSLASAIEAEITAQLPTLGAHACVSVISGGSEIEQQAYFYGVQPNEALDGHHLQLPALADRFTGVPFVSSSPSGGGTQPLDSRSGVSHYFGVGAYLRGPDDARRAEIRFAAECLAFATPPEPETVREVWGDASATRNSPSWQAAVYHDAGVSWNFDDVTQHYVRQLYPNETDVAFTDPERALDLSRAAVAELFTSTLTEWRRPASPCAGALTFHHHDNVVGPGLGMVDAFGRPKSSWYAMKHVMAPIAVLVTDEGLNGLDAHLFNDTPVPVTAELSVELFGRQDFAVETIQRTITLAARSARTVPLNTLFRGFRDLNHAYRFGPRAYEAVAVSLMVENTVLHTSVHVTSPGVSGDITLTAELVELPDDLWEVRVSTDRLAHWVAIDCPGFAVSDSWFHLTPSRTRSVPLVRQDGSGPPVGSVRALNSRSTVPLGATG